MLWRGTEVRGGDPCHRVDNSLLRLSLRVARRLAIMYPSSPPSHTCFMVIVPTLLISLSLLKPVLANPILTPFDDCFIGNATQKLNVSSVYAQITTTESLGKHLNLTVFGESAQEIVGYQNGSSDLCMTVHSCLTSFTKPVISNSILLDGDANIQCLEPQLLLLHHFAPAVAITVAGPTHQYFLSHSSRSLRIFCCHPAWSKSRASHSPDALQSSRSIHK